MLVRVCGRYAAAKDMAAIMSEFDVDTADVEALTPDYNVAPTKQVYVVRDNVDDGVHRHLLTARWGFVPTWAKDPSIGARMINARLETAAEKPAYRQAFAKRRCLVPADGYYEWYTPSESAAPRGRSGKPVKQPFYIHRTDGASLAMAGLLSWWRPADDAEWQLTMAVLTTDATPELARIHDRMPVLVPRQHWQHWLDPSREVHDVVDDLLPPVGPQELTAYPVSTSVNNVRNNGAQLLEPLSPA